MWPFRKIKKLVVNPDAPVKKPTLTSDDVFDAWHDDNGRSVLHRTFSEHACYNNLEGLIAELSTKYKIPEKLISTIKFQFESMVEDMETRSAVSETKAMCTEVSDRVYILNHDTTEVSLCTDYGARAFELIIRERDKDRVKAVVGHGKVSHIGNNDEVTIVRHVYHRR